MLFLVDGPDTRGKVAFIDDLRTRLTNVQVCYGPMRRDLDTISMYEKPLWNYQPGTGCHLILKDWHYTDLVRSRVYGREIRLDSAKILHLELLLRTKGVFFINVMPHTLEDLLNQYADSIDAAILLRMHHECIHIFNHESLLNRVIWIPSSNEWPAVEIASVIAQARIIEHDAARLNPFKTYVGAPYPQLLIFGTKRSERDPCGAPAFLPRDGTAEHYFMRILSRERNRMELMRMGLAHACDVDDPKFMWEELGKPKHVVTLGHSATNGVSRTIKHRPAYHPKEQMYQHQGMSDVEYLSTIFDYWKT